MIFVQYPPTLFRNINGKEEIVPSYFTELFLPEESDSIISDISESCFVLLKERKYSSIQNFIVYDLNNGLAMVHFQIPKYNIDQDSLEYDNQMISYYGIIRYAIIPGDIKDLIKQL